MILWFGKKKKQQELKDAGAAMEAPELSAEELAAQEAEIARDEGLPIELDEDHERAEDDVPDRAHAVQDVEQVEQRQHTCAHHAAPHAPP